MRRLIAILAVTAIAIAIAADAAAARAVSSGVIAVGRGAGPITLGMSRAQVIAKLGWPLYENSNGYMQYANPPAMFDAYLILFAR